MKKFSIIARLVFTTLFFASCEQQEIIPGEYAEAPQPSRTLILENEKQVENQVRKESLPKLKDIAPAIDIEKGAVSAHN
jgi:PBP1b-binding outer membrane lipoprotein LpoB